MEEGAAAGAVLGAAELARPEMPHGVECEADREDDVVAEAAAVEGGDRADEDTEQIEDGEPAATVRRADGRSI